MLLLGRPLGASAAQVGGLLSTGQVRPQQLSVAVALSFSFPSPWISISQHRSKERQGSPFLHLQNMHGFGDTKTEILSFDLLLCLPEDETPHGHRHYVGAGLHTGEPLDRSPIRLPMSSTLIRLKKRDA